MNLNFFKKEKALVLIEPGGIGDYIFVRPYLKLIKQSEKFKNHKIIYVAKESYADFTQSYDREFFDEIIIYNDKEFSKNKPYTKYILSKFKKYNIETLVNLRTINIPYLPDVHPRRELVKKIKAKTKIADVISTKEDKKQEKKLRIYNRVVFDNLDFEFELLRRKKFFEKLLEMKIDTPILEKIETIFTTKENYIMVSIGAMDKKRAYSNKKWKIALDYLCEKMPDKKILFLGTKGEFKQIQDLIDSVKNNKNCINFAGKSKLSDIPHMFSNCELLIAVDTGTVHLAQIMNAKTICISNGVSYGRFHPYKNDTIAYIYPDNFEKDYKEGKFNEREIYNGFCPYKTEDIDPNKIIEAIKCKITA